MRLAKHGSNVPNGAHSVQHTPCTTNIFKIEWKATTVSKLTYANSVLVMDAGLRLELEKTQRDARRWTLGIPGARVSNEFVEGELGWSCVEARDAQSKLRYLERMRSMPHARPHRRTN